MAFDLLDSDLGFSVPEPGYRDIPGDAQFRSETRICAGSNPLSSSGMANLGSPRLQQSLDVRSSLRIIRRTEGVAIVGVKKK